jgi:ubiquinone/menaquinone biosynthesis C-methylase UbiE
MNVNSSSADSLGSQRIKQKVASYYDETAGVYSSLYRDELSKAENFVVQKLLSKELPNKQARVLDLGSGHGLSLSLIDWENYVGLDISENMVAEAKKRFPSAEFRVLDMEEIDYPDSSFDYVISLFGSLSHSPDPQKTIDHIYRILKPGGRIFIMVYSQYSLNNYTKLLLNGNGLEAIGPIQEYQIRNSGDKSTFARFYSTKKINSLFDKFTDRNIIGLNAMCELSIFKRKLQTSKWALKCLSLDNKLTKLLPGLGHSLILMATKPK